MKQQQVEGKDKLNIIYKFDFWTLIYKHYSKYNDSILELKKSWKTKKRGKERDLLCTI